MPYALAISSGVTSPVPSASVKLSGRSLRMPARRAKSITGGTPSSEISRTATVFLDSASARPKVMVPSNSLRS